MYPRTQTSVPIDGRKIRLLVVLATVIAAVATIAPQASALSASPQGSPGQVSFSPSIQGSHWMAYPGVFSPYLMHQGIEACRSLRTSGTQTVVAQYVVYRWNGSVWAQTNAGAAPRAQIPAGVSCVRLPNFVSQAFTTSGYFYVEATYSWFDAYGYRLGTQQIRFNAQQDYACATFRPCQLGPGYIFLG